MNRGCVLLLCVLAGSAAGAPLTGAEKSLLSGAISQGAAEGYGRAGEAAGLERIVALGDPNLVNSFGRGMQMTQQTDLPPEVESVVIAHFDEPRTGAALRALPARYRTRALFDLHYARIANAYRVNEPSIGQIMNTWQPGIEEDLLKLSPKLPKGDGIDVFTAYAARRRYPAVVPVLLAALGESFSDPTRTGWNQVFDGLLAYPSVDVWKRTAKELDRLREEGRITAKQYAAARERLDPMLKDPAAKLEWMRTRYALEEFFARASRIAVNRGRLELLKTTDPSAYLREQERYLLSQEEVAREKDASIVLPFLSQGRFDLAMHARFRARDPAAAAKLFAGAAGQGHDLARVGLADTYQFDLHDVPAAIEAYRSALEAARNPKRIDPYSVFAAPGSRADAWWKAWLAQEIDFLQGGRPFRGAIAEAELGGFFEVMLDKAVYVTGTFAPEFRVPNSRGLRHGRTGLPVGSTWSAAVDQFREIRRSPTLGERLEALPPSRLALMMGIRHASALPDADAILAYFARNDPSGYWSTCVLGTVYRLDHMGSGWQDEAVRSESAELLPGMTASETPRPLSVAAQRFMEARGLRAAPLR